VKLSSDSTTLTADVSGTYTASQLEQVITSLMSFRAQMEPQVPETLALLKTQPETSVISDDEPFIQIKLKTDGTIRLWIRLRGLGWIALNCTAEQTAIIRKFFVNQTTDLDQV
jgi:hypothetical protein